ncbi:aspartic peptidase domain-containing protein [Mycena pura]|uniref:Aspartic peptidase domain-containing protein n=1 Tax=Mycena pura TaxID=153505 RepID=A0AAD6V0M9_9AGAR|nr:aspartic peptidase domain-containing protein [Mycena pura]
MPASLGKGKGRATARLPLGVPGTPRSQALRSRDAEGSGGADGIVLPLEYSEDGPYDLLYTLPVLVGSADNPQNLSLQVDTGSSDLWIASSSCSSSPCSQAPNYNPGSTAVPTGHDFSITYLKGSVAGPIYWDTVTVGGYSITNQALAAADDVDSEPLNSQFSGILGLALPDFSVIAQQIPPEIGDAPDGAVWSSNLFSITPAAAAPAAPFLSLALERPGSPTVPSVLGIGRHPAALVPDPASVAYDMLYAPTANGPVLWKAAVHGITVYTNTSRMPIPLGRAASGTAFPSAVLDTGVPVILTTAAVANAIYGAIGVSPALNNMYYLPCTTPLNITVTLDNRAEIPLHPLDMSLLPDQTAADQSTCIGVIQTSADSTLSDPRSVIGDMVLGVPFLRNVYTVLAYDIPTANGTFALRLDTPNATVRPRLGLLGLTNPAVALDEFHRVRVLNLPLGDTSGGLGTNAGGGKKQSVGIDVLIGLGSFAALCALLFGARWLYVRLHLPRAGDGDYDLGAYDRDRDAKRDSVLGSYRDADDKEELRQPYKQSQHTVSTDNTRVEPDAEDGGYTAPDGDGLVQPQPQTQPLPVPVPMPPLPTSPHDNAPLLREHADGRVLSRRGRPLSVSDPLLPREGEEEEFGVPSLRPTSMAGIGTARHKRPLSGLSTSREGARLSMAPSLSRSPEARSTDPEAESELPSAL